MKVPEGVVFNCGNCAWMQKVEPPKGKEKDYPHGRGYCTFNPPAVFPMPQQTGNLADIQGKVQMGFSPFMLRPVVDGNEPPCGRYAYGSEMLKVLAEANPEDTGACCKDKGAKCEC
jgi:hypothetical protein